MEKQHIDITPSEIRLLENKKALVVCFDDKKYQFSAEMLRVESPSAEVQGHGKGEKKLVAGKKGITIKGLEPRGNYAIQIAFDDGHHTGIYTWSYLFDLGERQQEVWATYLDNMAANNLDRAPKQ